MNKSDVTKFFKVVQSSVTKHSPAILTGIGIAGMITTTVLAVKATPKAMELIEEEKDKKLEKATVEEARNWREKGTITMTPVEYIKTCWKPYIPAAVTGVFSVSCLIGANSVHVKRNAALATAYQISQTALSDYREKVVETIGEKKEHAIRDKVAEKKIEQNPPSNATVLVTGGGNTLIYDVHSDRYFRSDIDKVKRAVNNLNYRMVTGGEMYISLNEFYDEIGLKHTESGDLLGWRIDRGQIEVRYGSQITENGEPCIVIDHIMPPEYDYNKLY